MTKRIVKKTDFSKAGSHICICGLPANGMEEVTVLKSKEKTKNINKVKELEDTITNLEKDLKTKEGEIMAGKKREEKTDLQKSIDDAVQAALKKAKEESAELLKAKDEELAELKKEKIQKEKDEMTALCKGYSFVEDAEALSDAFMLCKSIKGFDLILDTLEKARTAIKASLEKENGTDEEADLNKTKEAPGYVNKVEEIMKSRKENN